MDIVFVIDSSNAVCRTGVACPNWIALLRFVADIVDGLNVGFNTTRVGVVRYGNGSAATFFYLSSIPNSAQTIPVKASLVGAILALPFLGGAPNLTAGLHEMRTAQFVDANGDRLGVPNVAVVVTPAAETGAVGQAQIAAEATAAVDGGVTLLAVGATGLATDAYFRSFVSLPQQINQTYFLSPSGYGGLSGLVGPVISRACVISSQSDCRDKVEIISVFF